MLTEDYCLLGDAESALPYARRLVTLDPLNESAHRLLMQVYIQVGQHNAALKQYQNFEQILRKELGLDPQPETHALYKQIRKGEIRHLPVGIQRETITPQNNLPQQLTSFIGREKEQAEIVSLARQESFDYARRFRRYRQDAAVTTGCRQSTPSISGWRVVH